MAFFNRPHPNALQARAPDRPHGLQIEPSWFEWLALGGLLLFATWLLGTRGVWALLLSSDPTGITLVIIVVFFASTLWCGARSRELQRQRRLLQAGSGEGWAAEYLAALRALGTDTLDNGTAWRRRSDSGIDRWLRADDSGIYRVATEHDLQQEPEPDKTPRFVLKLPLAVGTSWQAPTTTDLLRRNADFPPEIRHTHKLVTMLYSIEALGEALATRAGNFSDCIRVQGTAVMKLFADPVVGFKDMPLTTTERSCKGVGLVKLQRAEPVNRAFWPAAR